MRRLAVVALLVASGSVTSLDRADAQFDRAEVSFAQVVSDARGCGEPDDAAKRQAERTSAFTGEVDSRAADVRARGKQTTVVSGSDGGLTVATNATVSATAKPFDSESGCPRGAFAYADVGASISTATNSPVDYAWQLTGSISSSSTDDDLIGSACVSVSFGSDAPSTNLCTGGGGDPPTASATISRSGVLEADESENLNVDGTVSVATTDRDADGEGIVRWNVRLTLTPLCPAELSESDVSAADAPACEQGVRGRVTNGHDEPMAGVRVQLHELGSGDPLGAATTTEDDGRYLLTPAIDPDSYELRVTLVDDEYDPPLLETYFGAAAEPVNASVTVDESNFAPGSVTDVDLSFLESNLPDAGLEFLDDAAEIHRRSKQYLDWVITTLGVDPAALGTVEFRPFDVSAPCPTACYIGSDPPVIRMKEPSFYEFRDEPFEEGPVLEWHELTHHVVQRLAPFSCDGTNHGGWDNPSSCDSLQEGLAEALATFAYEQIEGGSGGYSGNIGTSLEANEWKAWSRRPSGSSDESIAVAALLWDLLDDTPGEVVTTFVRPPGGGAPIATAYRDLVSIDVLTLWDILDDEQPQSVLSLLTALSDDPRLDAYVSTTFDLDGDAVPDATALAVPFLMHGFHILEPSDADGYFRVGTPRGRTDHVVDLAAGGLIRREAMPVSPGSALEVRNGRPVPATVAVDVTFGEVETTVWIDLEPGGRTTRPVSLPPYVSRPLGAADPLPPCGPDNDSLVTVEVSSAGAERLASDSCAFAAAVLASDGAPALTYELTHPIDVVPGDDTNAVGGSVVEVAVLSTRLVDAVGQVDAASLRFGRTGQEASLRALPVLGPDCGSVVEQALALLGVARTGEDVNGDGRADLVCRFDVAASGLSAADDAAVVRGALVTGEPFLGRDRVAIG